VLNEHVKKNVMATSFIQSSGTLRSILVSHLKFHLRRNLLDGIHDNVVADKTQKFI
jgi:hypothetical protein